MTAPVRGSGTHRAPTVLPSMVVPPPRVVQPLAVEAIRVDPAGRWLVAVAANAGRRDQTGPSNTLSRRNAYRIPFLFAAEHGRPPRLSLNSVGEVPQSASGVGSVTGSDQYPFMASVGCVHGDHRLGVRLGIPCWGHIHGCRSSRRRCCGRRRPPGWSRSSRRPARRDRLPLVRDLTSRQVDPEELPLHQRAVAVGRNANVSVAVVNDRARPVVVAAGKTGVTGQGCARASRRRSHRGRTSTRLLLPGTPLHLAAEGDEVTPQDSYVRTIGTARETSARLAPRLPGRRRTPIHSTTRCRPARPRRRKRPQSAPTGCRAAPSIRVGGVQDDSRVTARDSETQDRPPPPPAGPGRHGFEAKARVRGLYVGRPRVKRGAEPLTSRRGRSRRAPSAARASSCSRRGACRPGGSRACPPAGAARREDHERARAAGRARARGSGPAGAAPSARTRRPRSRPGSDRTVRTWNGK